MSLDPGIFELQLGLVSALKFNGAGGGWYGRYMMGATVKKRKILYNIYMRAP